MKKLLALLLALLTLCSLAACGGESSPALDLNEFYENEIAAKYELPALGPVEGEVEEVFLPGLAQLELKQKVLYMPMMNVHATEFLMAEAASEADAQKVEEIFQKHLEDLDSVWSQYLPQQYALVESAQVRRTGCFVTLIVSEYQAEIEDALSQALK